MTFIPVQVSQIHGLGNFAPDAFRHYNKVRIGEMCVAGSRVDAHINPTS